MRRPHENMRNNASIGIVSLSMSTTASFAFHPCAHRNNTIFHHPKTNQTKSSIPIDTETKKKFARKEIRTPASEDM